MRQAMLILAMAIGSPLAMAQSVVDTVKPAEAPRHIPAASTTSTSLARKPLSPIGRALADLLREANLQRAQANVDASPRRAIDNPTTIDAEAASRARLAAETERVGVP